jgi:hypothetical protein
LEVSVHGQLASLLLGLCGKVAYHDGEWLVEPNYSFHAREIKEKGKKTKE